MKGYVADPSASSGVVLRELSDPEPAPGIAVVAINACSLNRGEVQHVARYHLVPVGERVGWDFAGVVVAAATDGTGPPVGTDVFGWCRDRGSWAEQAAVPVGDMAPSPPGLAAVDGSTLGVAALTAHAAYACARRPLPSASVLVTGATGGVGSFAVQLAVAAGATTTASVRRAEDARALRALAGQGFDVEVGVDPDGPQCDVIVEAVGGDLLTDCLRRVAPGGVVVSLARTDGSGANLRPGWFLKNARLDGLAVHQAFATPGTAAAALAELGRLVVAGELRTGVSMVVPADELDVAMRALIDREVRGKVVVTWDDRN